MPSCEYVSTDGVQCSAEARSSKSGTGVPNMCKKHGGGDRCQTEGCAASAVTSKSGT
jgi:hypothetical protein